MRIDTEFWQPFLLSKLFDIKKGKRLTSEDQMEGDYIYVGAIESNNGVAAYIGQEPIHEGNTISLSYNGSVGEAFYQAEAFWATDDVNVLYPHFEGFNRNIGLFISTVLRLEKIRFSYGRKWTLENMQNTMIKLPVLINSSNMFIIDDSHLFSDEGYIPDWQFMEDYIKSLHYKPIKTQNENSEHFISTNEWKEFRLKDIFNLKGGFYNKKPEHSSEGSFPFLGSTENNNGVTEFYSLDDIFVWDKTGGQDNTFDKKIFEGNCITVTVNGSVCNAFYQKEKFTCSHDITALYLIGHDMNQYIALFLCTIIMMDKYRWSYGRKPHDVKKFGRSFIKLPVNSDGTPDWQYMEDYIKSLPYGDRI